jgi:hypothetical protein
MSDQHRDVDGVICRVLRKVAMITYYPIRKDLLANRRHD